MEWTPGEPHLFDGWAGGLTWLARPTEVAQPASHALVGDGAVWVVDPVHADGVHEAIAELGTVAGVVVLLDRHTRDAAAFAERYGVTVHVPEPLTTTAEDLGAPVKGFEGDLADSGYRARPVVRNRFWREAALVSEDWSTVLVPEALGTASYYTAVFERIGVHPALRAWPPRRQLGDLEPERLLVGHGPPVHEGAGPDVQAALASARRRAPGVYWQILRSAVRG